MERPGCHGKQAVCGKNPQQRFFFSASHIAQLRHFQEVHVIKRHSKCAFAYIIIIIQSRAAFNPCCLFYTKKIVFFAQKAELFVNMCRFSRKKAAAQRFVQRPCTGGTISNGSACALTIFSGSSSLRPTRKNVFGALHSPYRFTKFSTRTSSSMCTG